MTTLITGSSGFIGRHLLASYDDDVITVSRNAGPQAHIAIGDIAQFNDWETLFQGVDVIIHLAARVHRMEDGNPALYDRDNIQVVKRMAAAAVSCGVRRFIFLSSIKVNGEYTQHKAFSPFDTPSPSDPYGQSKLAAEQLLMAAASTSEMEVAIIRPPLVYGPGVKENFQRLLSLARLPLPFALVNNRRDMVSVYNLCDLIVSCIDHPSAVNRVFLVSDGQPYSLSTLLHAISRVQGRRSLLWPFPVSWLSKGLGLLGKEPFVLRLFGDLELDISDTKETLGWQPKYTLEETLRKMIK